MSGRKDNEQKNETSETCSRDGEAVLHDQQGHRTKRVLPGKHEDEPTVFRVLAVYTRVRSEYRHVGWFSL